MNNDCSLFVSTESVVLLSCSGKIETKRQFTHKTDSNLKEIDKLFFYYPQLLSVETGRMIAARKTCFIVHLG